MNNYLLKKDYTDCTRTSPFAFTGQKFEFRAVGSSQSLSTPLAYLYTGAAEALDLAYHKLETYISGGWDKDKAVLEVIKELYREVKPVVFNGNNYSNSWLLEAEKRGLFNIPYSFEALKVLTEKETTEFFERYQVLSKAK